MNTTEPEATLHVPPASKQVTIHTDGSCIDNPGRGGYGVVLEYQGRRKELSGGYRRTTNNRMELLAVIEGLAALQEPCDVNVFSDSQYVVNAISRGWALAWRAKGWRRGRKGAEQAKNADLWARLLELCDKHHRVTIRSGGTRANPGTNAAPRWRARPQQMATCTMTRGTPKGADTPLRGERRSLGRLRRARRRDRIPRRRTMGGDRRMTGDDWTERTLPEGPAAVFRRTHRTLTGLLGEGAFALGGGTALAAVWQHRHSTDIDLFTDSLTYTERIRAGGGPERVAAALQAAWRPHRLAVHSGFLTASLAEGDLSLMTSPLPLRLEPQPPSDRVQGTRVPLERPASILARKLHGRMLANGVLVLRDLYDLAAAATLDRRELDTALQSLSVHEKRMIADELSSLPADWAATPRNSGRPVLRPRLPPELARDPERAVAVVRTLLTSDNGTWGNRRRARTRSPGP